ncbi:aminoglycoside phosphotransferase family protein [Paenibacillus sp. WC2504]|uniref:aminoglycoside phosphotransferase family protein n=1 Tax=Paenibacillus sp. WC2504 TaxID=3461403 RepID=UPI004045F8F6
MTCHCLRAGEECLEYLIATTNENLILHGDLYHDNILRQGEEKWSVIDPKDIISVPEGVYNLSSPPREI